MKSGTRFKVIKLLLSVLAAFLTCTIPALAQAVGAFVATGNMTVPRSGHTATMLPNGKVLIAGGIDRGDSYALRVSAELYDPVTGMFAPTGNMTTGRSRHSAVLLPDGRVLIAGGDALGTAELYDPVTATFSATGTMVATQNGHTATLLNNGKVLIAGGWRECPEPQNLDDGCLIVERPEVYDSATGTFTVTGDYADRSGDPWFATAGLVGASAMLLPNGKVLIASEPTAELYDPVTGTFELAGRMTRGTPEQPTWQIGGTATLLRNGKVLLAGGEIFESSYLADAELYDLSTGTFTRTGNMIKARDGHIATLLSDGTVLIAGGQGWDCIGSFCYSTGTRSDAELYDPSSGAFISINSMTAPRLSPAATLLNDGRVLIAGGDPSVNTAELYVPSVVVLAPVVTDLRIAQTIAAVGSSYSVNFSGYNLTDETFFDVRFTSPGGNASGVVLNWQKGVAESHVIPIGIASGIWTINGVRPHQVEMDHTGSFISVSATITVSP